MPNKTSQIRTFGAGLANARLCLWRQGEYSVEIVSYLFLGAFLVVVPIYLYAVYCLYGIIKDEKPEWLEVKGSLSFFYDGMPRINDPNVQVELMKIIFNSSKIKELKSHLAGIYAKRIRVLLALGLLFFGAGITGVIASVP